MLTTQTNITTPITKSIPFFSTVQLQTPGKASIQYCDKGDCGKKPVTHCEIDWRNSFYDSHGWQRLWKDVGKVDMEIVKQHQIMVKSVISRFEM